MNPRHPSEFDLALYAGQEQALVARVRTGLHVRGCVECAARVKAYRADREVAKTVTLTLPSSIDWNRLSEEMTGNIRVGLAAGECVAPAQEPKRRFAVSGRWQQAAAVAGLTVFVFGAWWLNMPASESNALRRVGRALWTGTPVAMLSEPGAFVEASQYGVQVRQNGSAMAVTTPGSQPVAVSVSMQGSARARYVDAETGQMTITTVYVQ